MRIIRGRVIWFFDAPMGTLDNPEEHVFELIDYVSENLGLKILEAPPVSLTNCSEAPKLVAHSPSTALRVPRTSLKTSS